MDEKKVREFIYRASSGIGLQIMNALLKRYTRGANAQELYKEVGGRAPKRFGKALKELTRIGLVLYSGQGVYYPTAATSEWLDHYDMLENMINMAKKCKAFGTTAKLQALDGYGKFLRANLTTPPSEARVLCLPSTEFLEGRVYQQLGIPESNIYGVENDPKIQKILEKKRTAGTLGINLFKGDIKDFIGGDNNWDERFDVVFLDFDSHLQKEYLMIVEQLYRTSAIEDGGILALTYKRGREKEAQQALIRETSQRIILSKIMFDEHQQSTGNIIEKLEKVKKGDGFIPRDDFDHMFGILDFFVKIEDALGELGLSNDQSGLMEAISNHEGRLMKHMRKALLPVNKQTVLYQSGSPMKMIFYKLQTHAWQSYFSAIRDVNKVSQNGFPIHEIKAELKGPDVVPLVTQKPRELSPAERKLVREKAKRAKKGEISLEAIMKEHRLTPYQVRAFMAWESPNLKKKRKSY